MLDEAGSQAWLANMRSQFVGDGGGGYVMGGGYPVVTGGPGAASSIFAVAVKYAKNFVIL